LFDGPDDCDLTGNNIPQATCAKYDCVGASTQKAARGLLLHRKYDQLKRTSQVDRHYRVLGSFPANFIRRDPVEFALSTVEDLVELLRIWGYCNL
jgi:hypothetical protein